uniref:Uncharacterized protein n=1 Tax=viral metagenome TaxID=1070528 RepID=A0A6M3LM66_9ZZZZ
MLYHIYTEDKPNLADLASKHFEGFTILKGIGYWQGEPEPCAVIEIIDDKNAWVDINALALLIKQENKQQAVLITQTSLDRNILV